MGNKPVSPLVTAAVIAAVILLIGIIGWRFVSGARTGPNGEDLSKPAAAPKFSGPPATK
jgi:hypothetical protein